MTANDVVATANYIISCAKDTSLTNKGYYANLRYFVKEIKARDNYTVEVRADRQYYGVLYAMTFPVLPRAHWKAQTPRHRRVHDYWPSRPIPTARRAA